MKRFLAVLAAIGMVAGALFVRDRIDDGGSGGGGGGGGGGERLVCAPELAEACRQVSDDVTATDPATTAEGLLTADRLAFDGWVTVGPWPAMVDELRRVQNRPPLFDEPAEALASTGLTVVGGDEVPSTWRQLGEQVGGGDLTLGWTGANTALGVVALGAFTQGWFGGEPLRATNDLDLDPGFFPYLDDIVSEAEVDRNPVERLLQSRAFFDTALALDADAEAVLASAGEGRREGLTRLYPEPVVNVEAVLAGPEDLVDDLTEQLIDAGWVGEAGQGSPAAGVMAALWNRVSR